MQVKLLPGILFFFIASLLPGLLYAQADLAIIQAVANNVNVSRNLTYSILVVNNGPGSASNVTFTDNLPVGTTFVSFTAPAGWNVIAPVVGVNAPVIATIPTLPAGAMQIFSLVVRVGNNLPAGTLLASNAIVSNATPDPDPTNNQAVGTTLVTSVPPFDIGVINRSFPTVNTEAITVNLIQVFNTGSEGQLSVSLTDMLPSGTTFVSLSSSAGWTTTTPQVG